MIGSVFTPRPVLARGLLASLAPKDGSAIVTEPTVGQKKLLWYSDASFKHNADGTVDQPVGFATRYRRIFLALKTNIDGQIIIEQSSDGKNYDFVTTLTYTAADSSTWKVSIHPETPWMKIYFNDNGSAGPPTTWRFSLEGDESSAEPGA